MNDQELIGYAITQLPKEATDYQTQTVFEPLPPIEEYANLTLEDVEFDLAMIDASAGICRSVLMEFYKGKWHFKEFR